MYMYTVVAKINCTFSDLVQFIVMAGTQACYVCEPCFQLVDKTARYDHEMLLNE